MATSYALPASAIPQHHHHHSSDHLHSHGHSHSHSPSPPSVSSLSPSRNRRDSRANGHSRGRSHNHDHNSSHHHANSTVSLQSRPDVAPLAPSSHWRTGSTAGGKPLITPTDSSFDLAHKYEAPSQSHSHHHHDHHDHHDHGAERSKFTGLLLNYTSKWPLLHAIMTEKDSRRIFYFMTFVSLPLVYGELV